MRPTFLTAASTNLSPWGIVQQAPGLDGFDLVFKLLQGPSQCHSLVSRSLKKILKGSNTYFQANYVAEFVFAY